jgi:hypothetical protein
LAFNEQHSAISPKIVLVLLITTIEYYIISLCFGRSSEFLATDPEARVRFPALPDFLKNKTVVGLEPRSYLEAKVAAPV